MSDVGDLMRFLSLAEKKKALRFRAESAKTHFVTGRAVLRHMLAAYVGKRNKDIHILKDVRGKPYLSGFEDVLQFNLSHAHQIAVFAFGLRRDVGIDIERVYAFENISGVAHQFFRPEESSEIVALSGKHRANRFFWYWTAKEAYVKAIGAGLSLPFNLFSIGAGADGQPRVISSPLSRSWSLRNIPICRNYVATLAYADSGATIKQYPLVTVADILCSGHRGGRNVRGPYLAELSALRRRSTPDDGPST